METLNGRSDVGRSGSSLDHFFLVLGTVLQEGIEATTNDVLLTLPMESYW